MELHSDSISNNWKSVKLDTDRDYLVSLYDNVYPIDNSIIIYNYDKLFQFDYSGKFLRTIAQSGNGPMDINNLIACVVDSKQEYLYLIDLNPAHIKVFSLIDNRFEKPIPIASKTLLTAFCLINDSTFLCFPEMGANRQQCYTQDFNGNYLNNSKPDSILRGGIHLGMPLKVMKSDNQWFCQGQYEDTVFNALSKEPVVVFSKGKSESVEEIVNNKGRKEMVHMNKIFSMNEMYVFSKIIYKLIPVSEGAIEMHESEYAYFLFNWKNHSIKHITSFYFEPLKKQLSSDEMHKVLKHTTSFNHDKIVIMFEDEIGDDNPTIYVADLLSRIE